MATVADYLVERIQDWGVELIFGYPGDGINGVVGAIDRADGAVRFVQVAHEELGSFGSSAYAKYRDEPNTVGVCLATGGPGAAHLMVGLYDAKADHQPVVALIGQVARRSVSYTHLRAHETELDLECRLLLEQKTCHQVQPNQETYQKLQKYQPATYLHEVHYKIKP